jgi:hypothetical protein
MLWNNFSDQQRLGRRQRNVSMCTPRNSPVTGGCSCEQIIAELELGDRHVKFGC